MNKILVIVAHPDDEVLGCGATIAKHTENGDKVQVVFVADGFSSREAEDGERNLLAIEVAGILGCENPIFLDFPDNKLDTVPLLRIIKEIEKNINNLQPNIIYTHYFSDLNIDHQITHKAVMTACRPQPDFCVKEIYSFETLSATHWQSSSMGRAFNPNYFVDASGFMKQKIRALQSYDNEMRDYPHARSYKTVESLAKFRGSVAGVQYAEAFIVERLIK
jgi:LmbE family N-acetylglucosaminyl deacetylase